MAKLELFHLGCAGKADHLMTQADAKQRHLANKLLHLCVRLLNGVRVARAVGKKDTIGMHFQHARSRGVPRHHGELAANAHQTLENAALDAAVVHDHTILGGHGGSIGEGMGSRQVRGCIRILIHTAHGLDQILAHQRRRLGKLRRKLREIKNLGRDDALLSAMVAQVAHERTGIDALHSHDAVVFEVLRHAYGATPIGRGVAHIVHDHATKCRGRGCALGRTGIRTLHVIRIDAVVANLRVCHGDNLTCIRGVGQNFEISLE